MPIELYHTSSEFFKYPCLDKSRNLIDFGKGFYLTSYQEQAENFAKQKMKRRKPCHRTYIYKYTFDIERITELNVMKLLKYDEQWYNVIKECRRKADDRNNFFICKKYDLIYDRMADNNVIGLTKLSSDGLPWEDYRVQEAAANLRSKKDLRDQYCFKTEKALQMLHLQSYACVKLENGEAKIICWNNVEEEHNEHVY